MSAIALKWAYSQPIGSPVAKNILAFLASHNFPGNKTFFGIQTISDATAFSRRAVIDGLKWLVDNKYLLKEIRLAEDGGQKSNTYILNIPSEYVDNFCADYGKLSTPPVQEVHGGGAGGARGGVQEVHPNNNAFNNNINKSFYADAKKNRAVENSKKHSWSEKPKAPTADVTQQSTSWKPNNQKNKPDPSPEVVKVAMMSLPRKLRPKKYKNEANEFPTRTEIQSKMAREPNAGSPRPDNDAGRGKGNPSPFRSLDGLLEARGAHSYLEEIGLAS